MNPARRRYSGLKADVRCSVGRGHHLCSCRCNGAEDRTVAEEHRDTSA
jgi:hypothetical protein